MKAVVFNLGCKVNQYECDAIAAELAQAGYVVSEKLEKADLYIVNTCAVTAEAERKSRQVLSRIRKLDQNARITVIGCASQKNKDFYIGAGAAFVGGTGGKSGLVNLISGGKSGTDFALPLKYEDTEALPKGSRTRAYVKIEDGCDRFCSYCIIPYLRGRARSRTVASAAAEIRALSSSVAEIVLTGINLSAYGKDTGESLEMLIREIKDVPARIRLGSFYAEGIDEGLLFALSELHEFCPHFHLSLQHGDSGVLADMNRKYTPEEYADKVALIRKFFPLAAITTDVIVGYPTETEESFLRGKEFLEKTAFADLHIFPYSRREGTAAARLAPLPVETVAARAAILADTRSRLRENYLSAMIGVPQKVVFEGKAVNDMREGYSEYYIRIYAQSEADIAVVSPRERYKNGLKGEIIL